MNSLVALQHWLYSGMASGLGHVAGGDVRAIFGAMVAAVLFGALHALMPGHGKTILVSYHLGQLVLSGGASAASARALVSELTLIVEIGLEFSITVATDSANGLVTEPRQILQELGLAETVKVDVE